MLVLVGSEKELIHTKSDMMNLTAERDSIREDLVEVRDAKRKADQAFRDQTARLKTLEREVQFYRQQAAQAIAQRDNSSWECEQLRQRCVDLDGQLRQAVGRAETAETALEMTERRATLAERAADELQEAAAAAKYIPLLRSELERAKGRENELKSEIKYLKRDLKSAKEEIQAAAVQFEEAEAEHLAAAAAAAEKISAVEEECATVREGLSEVTQQKIELLMRISRTEAGRARADAQLVQVKESLAAVQEQLNQATQEKVNALMQIAELEAQLSGSEAGKDPSVLNKRSPVPSSPVQKGAGKGERSHDRWRWLGSSASSLGRSP